MSLFEMFGWGVFGSVAIEAATLAGVKTSERWSLPEHYKSFNFWCVRAVLAIFSGGLAVAHGATTPLLCIHIGAATPLILQTFAKNAPANGE